MKYLILFPLLLSGCAYFDNPGAFKANTPPPKVVQLVATDKHTVAKMCGKRQPRHGEIGDEVVGCAVVSKDKCTIYTFVYTTEEILGHELRHCFYGAFHD